jgi:uncharacterized protein with PIN domain
MEMKPVTIRTNDKCERCGGFLIFEVRDERLDEVKNKTMSGLWICMQCEKAMPGVVIRNLELRAIY